MSLNVGMAEEEGSISNYTYIHFISWKEIGLETQSLKWRTNSNNWNFQHNQNCQGFMCVFTNSCVSLQIYNVRLYKFCIWNDSATSGKMKGLNIWHEVGVQNVCPTHRPLALHGDKARGLTDILDFRLTCCWPLSPNPANLGFLSYKKGWKIVPRTKIKWHSFPKANPLLFIVGDHLWLWVLWP